jgi:outer membrane immunogenic protein
MRFLVGAVILTMAAGAAAAADMPVKAQLFSPTPVMNWTGIYGGVWGGHHQGNVLQSGCTGICPVNPKLKGGVFGIQVGFDYQLSNGIVLGAFGALPLSRPQTTFTPAGVAVTPRSAEIIGGRIGYAVNRFLPYFHGGYARAKVDGFQGFTGVTATNVHNGYTLGGGLEYAITQNWSVDGRYTYMHLPEKTYDVGGGPSNWGENSHNFTVAVNYRWWGR